MYRREGIAVRGTLDLPKACIFHCDNKDAKHGLKIRSYSVQSVSPALASEFSAYVVA